MPANRNALLRYRTIDGCLQNRGRTWTLEDLIDACSNALYEYEGRDESISKRTIQGDIQMMRSDKLGYNAPIIVSQRKYYTYSESDYSITNIPLSTNDLNKLNEAADILRQFKGFNHFQDLGGMVEKLEEKIQTAKTDRAPIIDFEKNENLRGLEYIDPIYQSIKLSKEAQMIYQSFKAREASEFTFQPYFLKEFRNRWFVLGYRKSPKIWLKVALDRIQNFEASQRIFKKEKGKNLEDYFKHVIGATVHPNGKIEHVRFFIERKNAPYVLTKPLHHSQTVVEQRSDGTIFEILVQHNFELEKELLAFGEQVKVLQPARLKRAIKERLAAARMAYDLEMDAPSLVQKWRGFQKRGMLMLPSCLKAKQIKHFRSFLSRRMEAANIEERVIDLGENFETLEPYLDIIFSPSVKYLFDTFRISKYKIEIVYFPKGQPVLTEDWSQFKTADADLHCFIPLTNWNKHVGQIEALPGSHAKRHTQKTISIIGGNASSNTLEATLGSLIFLHPNIIHRWQMNNARPNTSAGLWLKLKK